MVPIDVCVFFFFKQKTAYELRISDWSSDVCSSDLGVPTTRALSLVGTGDEVVRDMFYDGHPRAEPGAIVCRVAPSFLRFGSFELPASRGEVDLLRQLAEIGRAHV